MSIKSSLGFGSPRKLELIRALGLPDNAIFTSIASLRAFRKSLPADVTVGLVPTMGSVHPAHLKLVKTAKKETDIVFSTIFVNPGQFSPHEDFHKYPRDEESDIKKLVSAGSAHVFVPSVTEIYPNFQDVGFRNVQSIHVVPDNVDSEMSEGISRPGFFTGVLTVCAKLFNIVQPSHVYFGQKDGTQLLLVSKMVHDLNYPLKVVPVQTLRETDGLAMSSRNAYLGEEERETAKYLYRGLLQMEQLIKQGGNVREVRDFGETVYRSHGMVCEYISFCRFKDGKELEDITEVDLDTDKVMISVAVNFGKGRPRLIDNILI